jgi:hypothetical protein
MVLDTLQLSRNFSRFVVRSAFLHKVELPQPVGQLNDRARAHYSDCVTQQEWAIINGREERGITVYYNIRRVMNREQLFSSVIVSVVSSPIKTNNEVFFASLD